MKILLPVDGSDISLEAVRRVVQLAREGLRASVVLANVQEPASLYEMLVAHDAEVLDRISAEAGVHAMMQAEALLQQREETCVVERLDLVQDPVRASQHHGIVPTQR